MNIELICRLWLSAAFQMGHCEWHPCSDVFFAQETGRLGQRLGPVIRMKQPQAPTIGLTSGLLLLGLATVWGGSFFFAEISLRELPPLTIALHRVFWAVLVLFLVVLIKRVKIPRSARLGVAT
jgi:hypothetical protein